MRDDQETVISYDVRLGDLVDVDDADRFHRHYHREREREEADNNCKNKDNFKKTRKTSEKETRNSDDR